MPPNKIKDSAKSIVNAGVVCGIAFVVLLIANRLLAMFGGGQ